MSDLDTLKREWSMASKIANASREALREHVLSAFHLHVGDKIKVVSYGREKIAVVTSIRFDVQIAIDGTVKVTLRPIAYPLKKNGNIAEVGQIYIWHDDKVEVLERAS